jgi:hypothetical protein
LCLGQSTESSFSITIKVRGESRAAEWQIRGFYKWHVGTAEYNNVKKVTLP